jgi:GNAT superfamily N-acetyltransferase
MIATSVRPALPGDVPRLVALMAEFYGESGYPLPAEAAARTFRHLLADERLGRAWLLEDSGEAAGFVVLTFCFSMEYGGMQGFVDDLFVRPASRGRGLVAAGLAEVRRTCEALGVRALRVETGPENDPARRLYARSGFTDSGRLLLTLPLAAPVHEAEQANP